MKKTFIQYLRADKNFWLFLAIWVVSLNIGAWAWSKQPVYGFYLWVFWFMVGVLYFAGRYSQYKKR